MRKLSQPLVDDDEILDKLRTARGTRARTIRSRLWRIRRRYDLYRSHNGDPWQVPEVPTFRAIRNVLHGLYDDPVKCLDFIGSLRTAITGACPVCGRDALGTLDHYLPRTSYAEFSFFSRNLVPACDRCNNTRNDLARGSTPGERPLHPYFDAFATRRVMTIRFEPDWRAPRLTPIPFDVTGTELEVVQWHIEHVICRAGIVPYLENLWGTLVNQRALFLEDVSTTAAMQASLQRQIRIESATGHSENAWRASFYHGLSLNTNALAYLATLP